MEIYTPVHDDTQPAKVPAVMNSIFEHSLIDGNQFVCATCLNYTDTKVAIAQTKT